MVLTRAQRAGNTDDTNAPPTKNMLKAPAKRGRKKEVVEEVKPKAKAAAPRRKLAAVQPEPEPEPEPIVEEVVEEPKPTATKTKPATTRKTTRSKATAKAPAPEPEPEPEPEPVAKVSEEPAPAPKRKTATRSKAVAKAPEPEVEPVIEEVVEEPKPVPAKRATTRSKASTKVQAKDAEEAPTKAPTKTRATAQKVEKKSNEIEIVTSGAAAAKRRTRTTAATTKATAKQTKPAKEEPALSSPKPSKIPVKPMQPTPTASPARPMNQEILEDPFTTHVSPLKAPALRPGCLSPAKNNTNFLATNVSSEKPGEASPFKTSSLAVNSEIQNLKGSLLSASPRKAPTASPLKLPPISPSKFHPDHAEASEETQFRNSILQSSARKAPAFSLSRSIIGSAIKPNLFAEEGRTSLLKASPRKVRIETPAKTAPALFGSSVAMPNPFSTSFIQASPMRLKTPARTPARTPRAALFQDTVMEEDEHNTPPQSPVPESTTPVKEPTQETVAGSSIAEEPAVDQPIDEEPIDEEPIAEDPIIEEPTMDEPIMDEPIADESIVEESVAEEFTAEEPITEESSVQEHLAEELDIQQSIAREFEAEDSDPEESDSKESSSERTISEAPISEMPAMTMELDTAEEIVVEQPVQTVDIYVDPEVDIPQPSPVELGMPMEVASHTPQQSPAAASITPKKDALAPEIEDETVRFGEPVFSCIVEPTVEAMDFIMESTVAEPVTEVSAPTTPTTPTRPADPVAVAPWSVKAAISELPAGLASPVKSSLRSPEKRLNPTSPKKSVSWQNPSPQVKSPAIPAAEPGVLAGTVFFVDVRSADGADAGGLFVPLLEELGARVVENWTNNNMDLTHVLFKDGDQMTLEKVVATNGAVKCVNIGWALE
ncbi:hypothetical protein AOQ84DRAFT_107794 [Glonium stellatum]|uniref:BRCT domain-containing protein n=1 Tax=Glonium stellatum TaxID=574774 RepID=A0A8E2JPL1_9PEZI|nr:hypothetical protein AOQ84DRAFT_107794 [Glonium stellatum]